MSKGAVSEVKRTVTVLNQHGKSIYNYTLPKVIPIVLVDGVNVSTIGKTYMECKANFKETKYYTDLVEFFEGSIRTKQSLPIDRIVCLGIGSYSHKKPATFNAYYQTAMVEVMLELLGTYTKLSLYQVNF